MGDFERVCEEETHETACSDVTDFDESVIVYAIL